MGMLIEGEWKEAWYDTKKTDGKFVRQQSSFRNWVFSEDDPKNKGEYIAEENRYHLFVSLACPWAHRTLVMRKLKKLEKVISVSYVKPDMLDNGWEFDEDDPHLNEMGLNITYLHELYVLADHKYTGRVTVPVLWDKKSKTIVNNESSEIIRMLNTSFHQFTDIRHDFYPEQLREEIDSINELIYHNVNNGVYKCGFATTQTAYNEAFDSLFSALEKVEERLAHQRYLAGNQITEADIRLFTTLVRFDSVYFGHFKANKQRISDYPQLSNYLRDIYQMPGISETVDITHIKRHYYYSHESVNPTRIVPKGPDINFNQAHNRNRF